MSQHLTVAICTYNRCESLGRTLETLVRQTGVDWSEVEVIIIDNNCTDDTAGVVSSFSGRLPIRSVGEHAQGLSHARNRALDEAKGEWIIFTDDDVLLESEWLRAYSDALRGGLEAHFAGGRVEPMWPHGAPAWFRGDELQLLDGVLVRCHKGLKTRFIEKGEPLFVGASFAVSAQLAKLVGSFRVDLGMNGNKLGRGEETDFMIRAQKLGCRGLYIAESMCWHPVDTRRLKLSSLYRYGVVSGIAHRTIVDHKARGSLITAGGYLARGLYQLARRRGDRFRQCVINAGLQVGMRGSDTA